MTEEQLKLPKIKNIISHTQGTALQGGKESQVVEKYIMKKKFHARIKIRWQR